MCVNLGPGVNGCNLGQGVNAREGEEAVNVRVRRWCVCGLTWLGETNGLQAKLMRNHWGVISAYGKIILRIVLSIRSVVAIVTVTYRNFSLSTNLGYVEKVVFYNKTFGWLVGAIYWLSSLVNASLVY